MQTSLNAGENNTETGNYVDPRTASEILTWGSIILTLYFIRSLALAYFIFQAVKFSKAKRLQKDRLTVYTLVFLSISTSAFFIQGV